MQPNITPVQLSHVSNMLDKIDGMLEEVLQKCAPATPTSAYSSAEIKDLAAALAKAQGEYGVVGFNRENPYFKSNYADLHAIMCAVRPALAKNNIAFSQQVKITDEGATVLHTVLLHSSGQWIESRVRIIPVKNDPQAYGSCLSYHKRYAAMALLGITVSHDISDDDGYSATADVRQAAEKGTEITFDPRTQSMETISKKEIAVLEHELTGYPDIAEMMFKSLKIEKLADVRKSQFELALNRIRTIKNNRNGE